MLTRQRILLTALFITGLVADFSNQLYAQSAPVGVKNIVLVHGAWADGSNWAKIIPMLEAKGYQVTAVQNPLTSLEDDVAATKRVIAVQDGPVLLVAHSWGGVVITQAGNDPKVLGLVYVAAFAPGDNESLTDAAKAFPPAPGPGEGRPDGAGFVTLTAKGVHQYFCPDLTTAERNVILATQGPLAIDVGNQKVAKAAWKTKPTWYLVASEDQMINPDLERSFAKNMKAKTLVLKSSHVPMLSQPAKVAAFITEAAGTVKPN
ncbi:alpha/beta fold hydrolase [Spirosoma endbachense]|uniref:Alpha/beta fold hydrolase n=1 Tax=Spirosoma endbachense TaxID=2666025 RepID=A0A6P1W5R3_9BACT|nr:alpha/beta hydrolase [Spirosoma endbachense]QHV99377.1 alpha/beta fold hydrolase [Spirosoma endbachense]